MANVIAVGAQWGDEGKGKIVDWLSSRADVVVRFQGGHNAGHTLVADGESYKMNLLPSGLIREGTLAVIGPGTVIDPVALAEEIERLAGQGVKVSPENLRIAENAVVILSLHRELDALREDASGPGAVRIGTTRRGIGPAYEDKAGRRAVRVLDLADPERLPAKAERLLVHHNALRKGLGAEPVEAERIVEEFEAAARALLPFAEPAWRLLREKRREGARILFEGAQGAMLDVDQGTYPFVTSSNTLAGHVGAGAGAGIRPQDYVLGIVKAYSTRVGEGPFPTEQDNEAGRLLAERGKEFGTVTGRKRRCGWFDSVLVRQAAAINAMRGAALTKLDVLDAMDEILLCVGYRLEGEAIDWLPALRSRQERIEPVYESFEGWRESSHGARSLSDLPARALKYVRRIEQLIGVPVVLLSTGPQRDATIAIGDPFAGWERVA